MVRVHSIHKKTRNYQVFLVADETFWGNFKTIDKGMLFH